MRIREGERGRAEGPGAVRQDNELVGAKLGEPLTQVGAQNFVPEEEKLSKLLKELLIS